MAPELGTRAGHTFLPQSWKSPGLVDELQGVDTDWSLGFAVNCILSGVVILVLGEFSMAFNRTLGKGAVCLFVCLLACFFLRRSFLHAFTRYMFCCSSRLLKGLAYGTPLKLRQ